MTKEQEQDIRSIIDIVSKEYNISLCSPVKSIKEAVDVTAFLISKNVGVKQYAIASILGRSTLGEFVSIANRIVKTRMRNDEGFNKKIINLEVKILSSKL
jgi:hypothetical protein